MLGRFLFQLRYDQLVLSCMAGLIGLTVVFAGGVERGKQLARVERPLLARQPAASSKPATSEAVETKATDQAVSSTPIEKPEKAEQKNAPVQTAPKKREPTKLASAAPPSSPGRQAGKSRYAIQVVTYSRLQLARQELERLQARGERAFLVIRDGRTTVYVGPFPSKGNASEKLTTLKTRYQDCFLRTL